MSSILVFFLFIPLLAFILLAINLIFAPHNPYMEKNSAFECGFSSFLGQNRTQFSISFFIFALLFLLFDLEILLVYPYLVSAYTNEIYGLTILLLFLLALTLGFAFELGKKALSIDSRQMSNSSTSKLNHISKLNGDIYSSLNNPPKPHAFGSTPLQSKLSPFIATTFFKSVGESTEVNSKEALHKDKLLEDTRLLANNEKIIKNKDLNKVSKETSLEDEILEDTHKLRNGELLKNKNIKKPSDCIEEQSTDCAQENFTSDVSIQGDFTTIDVDPSMESKISEKMAHLTDILESLDQSGSLLNHNEMTSVMLQLSNLWWLLFIFLMFILGILAIIIYLLKKANIKYLSKLSDNIKYINLTKSLASIFLERKKVKIPFKSLSSIKMVENIKNTLKSINNAIDFYKVIKYIANRFDYVNKKNKKLVLTSNGRIFPNHFNFLDDATAMQKRDLIIKDIIRDNATVTVYMYTMYGHGDLDMGFVEKHVRFNFKKKDDSLGQLNIPRYMDYLAQTNLLLDMLFTYATIRNLAYAYQYIVDYSPDSRLNSGKVRLANVHKLMLLCQGLGTVYTDRVTEFNLPRLLECIRRYEESLDIRAEQLIDVTTRYEYLEEIIDIMEDILKKLRPPLVTFEFMIIATVNTPEDEVKLYYYENYRKYAD